MINLGKMDGQHFSVSIALSGFSFFLPQTRRTNAISFGVAMRPNGRTGFNPFVTVFVINKDAPPFGRMWFLTAPHNVVRIGEFGCWNR